MAIHTLSIDVETFSDVDLKKCGVYKYAESPDFEILLFGVSVDGSEVTVYDLASGDTVPEEIIRALSDDSVIKWAYNASFERVCLSVWLRRNYPQYFSSYSIEEDTVRNYLDPSSWRCSLVWGAYMGLPLSLEGIGKVLKLENQKMAEGKALIRYFCVPCKPTKANGGRTRNLPEHDPVKWSTFIAYNKRDVKTEMAIQKKLSNSPRRISCGRNTISTRRSTTGASSLTWCWWNRPSPLMNVPGKNFPQRCGSLPPWKIQTPSSR